MKLFLPFRLLLFAGLVLPAASRAHAAAPLPPLETVLQRVMQTSEDENAQYHVFNQHYFYTRDRVTEFFDASGKLKNRHEKQSTNNPAPPLIVAVAPITTAAPPSALPSGDARTAEPPNVHGVALGKKEDLMNPDIIKRFKFTMAGRDMVNGRPALIIDFQPAILYRYSISKTGSSIQSRAGRGWMKTNLPWRKWNST